MTLSYIHAEKRREKNGKTKRQSLKLSYRADYFYTISNLPKHQRVYRKTVYIIRTFGKH